VKFIFLDFVTLFRVDKTPELINPVWEVFNRKRFVEDINIQEGNRL
jgi:hypothetical protein